VLIIKTAGYTPVVLIFSRFGLFPSLARRGGDRLTRQNPESEGGGEAGRRRAGSF